MNFQLRPEETALFEGDVTLLKSKLKVVQTDAVVTDQRLFVAQGQQTVEKADIVSATEEKHGFGTKLVFRVRDGLAIDLLAPNQAGLKAAAMILTGQAAMGSMPVAPKLAQVKNGFAWLAAFGPLLSGLIAAFLGLVLWGSPENWSGRTILYLIGVRLVLIWLFLRIDYLYLQKQGFNVKQLGLADPITFPVYLFSRAKVFGHGKAYAITWCVLFGLDMLSMLA